MQRTIFAPKAAITAANIGRLVERNLTNWSMGTMAELARADRNGEDAAPLLTIGLAVLRARQAVREGIRVAELQKRGSQR